MIIEAMGFKVAMFHLILTVHYRDYKGGGTIIPIKDC